VLLVDDQDLVRSGLRRILRRKDGFVIVAECADGDEVPAAVAGQLGVIYRFVYNKWYFDELYNFIFVRPAFWLGRVFWKAGDVGIIDRFGPNGAAWVVAQGSRVAQRVQSGYLYSYALVMLIGLVVGISWVMVR
jgi:NADH-quinone oxidoreductase subunit L